MEIPVTLGAVIPFMLSLVRGDTVRVGRLLARALAVVVVMPVLLRPALAQDANEPDDDELAPTGEQAYLCGLRTTGTIGLEPNLIRSGDRATLTWSSNQPPGCNVPLTLNGRLVQPQGSETFTVLATSEYTLAVPAKRVAKATVEVELCPLIEITGNSHEWARLLAQAVSTEHTTVRLADALNLDMTGFDDIRVREGVTLTSEKPGSGVLAPIASVPPAGNSPSLAALAPCPPHGLPQPGLVSGRVGLKLGPRLFTTSRPDPLFSIRGDNVRFSGFRLHGPEFGHDPERDTQETAIDIVGSIGVRIVNLELAGWTGQAILVVDRASEPRISSPEDVRIERNFFHHNQHAGRSGYGINVQDGAYVLIARNVFDFNRHAIAASGEPGVGYRAQWNLVLKGGGRHQWYKEYTHQFDVHGDSDCFPWIGTLKNCGNAGERFWFIENAFQYTRENDIQLRGRPRELAFIYSNVFPHSRLFGAVQLQTQENVRIGSGPVANQVETDTYGEYGVCDLDGDGSDDLFLPTGVSWWYSSAGRVHWVFLDNRRERLDDVGLGYFDGDRRCDVLTASRDTWEVSSGGLGPARALPGSFSVPFDQLRFADFNADGRTDIFRRDGDGNWSVVSPGVHDWRNLRQSSFPLDELRFGDFDGDRVADVLSRAGGHWSYSPGGAGEWRTLNSELSDELPSLLIADIDGNGTDDIIRFKAPSQAHGEWQVSRDGRTEWESLVEVTSEMGDYPILPILTFAGHFRASPRADLLHVDHRRLARLFNTESNALVRYNLYEY